ncbi:anaerobic selenocysteine-containing dehydrogenase [Murinocardiopsis flavida]|uniref:Anaerobic selenocysteine-containing dehydrogenase n=1 Tax=Murinocardiopsis flavida TaxID=645275 RepID=A0A2P8DER1_9ACTN|nr:molybdopterin-dependent oxidoreductase [Murinocardiopsis flavida]PSK95700.1 anaerobic selenocysteine-containing dehydrogenase [Murinocardiopsis flavida]
MPAETKRGYCTLCRSRCGALYTVESGRMTGVAPDPEHPTGTALCPKGRAAPEIAHSTRRLTRPLRRTRPKGSGDPGWEEIGWEEAMGTIAARFAAFKEESGAESIAFAVTSPSGTPMSDSIDWVERFIRLFGAANTCYSTEICNWHKDFAHAFTFGSGLPTADYANTDLAVLWGHNPAKTWLAQAVAVRNGRDKGARTAVVDPRRSTSARDAEHWLRVRPGSDAALALGTARHLIAGGHYDAAFVRSWTNGPLLVRDDNGALLTARDLDPGAPDAFVAWDSERGETRSYDTRAPAADPDGLALRGAYTVRTAEGTAVGVRPAFDHYAEACAPWTIERTARHTWIPEDELLAFAEEFAAARSVAYHSWTGVGQNGNATQTERAIATLYALKGCYDAPGGNLVLPKAPVNAVTALDQMDPAQRAKTLGLAERPLGPPATGWVTAHDLYTAMLDHAPYRVRALMGFGANLLVSQPDPERGRAALGALDFYVHCDLFLNPTAEQADIVLPVNSPWEHEALKTGFEISASAQELVQLRQRMVEPLGESRSDTEVVFDLACRLGMGDAFFGGDIDAAWDHVLAPTGLTVERLRRTPEGIRVPLRAEHRKYAAADGAGGVAGFATPSRRVELYSARLAAAGQPPVPDAGPAPSEAGPAPSGPGPSGRGPLPFLLTNAKNGYFCHSQHRAVSSLRRKHPEPTVDVAPELARQRGFAEGDMVEVATADGAFSMRAVLDPDLDPRVAVAEYGWWEAAPDLGLPGSDPVAGGTNFNAAVNGAPADPVSGSLHMRGVACDVRPGAAGHRGPRPRPFTVTAITGRGRDVVEVRLRPADGGPAAGHRPGQYIGVAVDGAEGTGEVARSYSLTGAPGGGDHAIAVRLLPGGALSTHVHSALDVGDTVAVTPPSGTFTIPADAPFPVVVIAAGVGFTPFLSQLAEAARHGGAGARITVHKGDRGGADVCFGPEAARLAAENPRVRLIRHFSGPGPGDRVGRDYDRAGRVSADAVAQADIDERARFYLCGPGAMIREVTDGLIARGVPRFEIFAERFAPPQRPAPTGDARHEVAFRASGTTLTWRPSDGPLLDLAQRNGVRLPSGCRVGQCESCAVRVLSGAVAHLTEPPDADDECLTCQAVPASDIVLDA